MSYRDRSPERGPYRREELSRRVSVMIRNLPKSIAPNDLRYYAEKYGSVKDVYLPKDFYSGEPRGLGFVEFYDERDAEEAVRCMDRMMLGGREVQANFAMQGRKRPEEYRRGGYGGGRDRGYDRGYDRGRDHDRYDRRDRDRDYDRERDYDRRDRDRGYDDRRRSRSRSRSHSASPARRHSRSPSPERRAASRSPARNGDYHDDRGNDRGNDRSPARAASQDY